MSNKENDKIIETAREALLEKVNRLKIDAEYRPKVSLFYGGVYNDDDDD